MRFRHHHHQQQQQQPRDVLERLALPIPDPLPELTTINGQVMSIFVVTATSTGGRLSRPSTTDSSNDQTAATASPSYASTTGHVLGTPLPPVSGSSSSTTDSSQQTTTQDAQTTQQPTTATQAPTTTPSAFVTTPATTTTGVPIASTTTDSATTALTTTDSSSNSTTSTGVATNSSSTQTGAAGSESTSSAASSQSTSSGMSTGGKVGLAVGIIAAIGAVVVLVLFLLSKKRKRDVEAVQAYDEKHNDYHNDAAPFVASKSSAPRLSLRPMSRLVPEMMGGARPKSRASQGNMLATLSEHPGRDLTATHGSAPANAPRENPFRDPANPFADPEKAAQAAGVAGATHMPASQQQQQPPPPLDQQARGPGPMDAGAANMQPAVGPVVAPGPGPDAPAGNVYRILMDFRPTMEDELELRAGQLVRLLHEYDDGWALCIRLDRSQQGVVPRTCLAAKASKPRPANGQQPLRPGQPGSPASGRMSPAVNRPMSPRGPSPGMQRPTTPVTARSPPTSPASQARGPAALRPSSPGGFNQAPRPLSPGPRPAPQNRSVSPGPDRSAPMAAQRRRSNSATAINVRVAPNTGVAVNRRAPGADPTARSGTPGVAY